MSQADDEDYQDGLGKLNQLWQMWYEQGLQLSAGQFRLAHPGMSDSRPVQSILLFGGATIDWPRVYDAGSTQTKPFECSPGTPEQKATPASLSLSTQQKLFTEENATPPTPSNDAENQSQSNSLSSSSSQDSRASQDSGASVVSSEMQEILETAEEEGGERERKRKRDELEARQKKTRKKRTFNP